MNIDYTRWLTPLNLVEERQKFLHNPNFNPALVYPKMPLEELAEYELELKQQLAETSGEEKVVAGEALLKVQLLLARNTPDITRISGVLYQTEFVEPFLSQAQADAAHEAVFEARETYTGEEVVVKMREYMHQYPLDDWQVVLSDKTDFFVRVKAAQKTILVSPNVNWDFTTLDGTLAHEIDGHVLRAVNASHQTDPKWRRKQPYYSKTEEGLACYLMNFHSTTGGIGQKHHALKYLAGQVAASGSFLDTFHFLTDHGFTPHLAFQRTFRLKRGMADTALPGCYMKEAMYYQGIIEVKSYLDHGGDIRKLYAGKISLADIEQVPLPTPLILPQRLLK